MSTRAEERRDCDVVQVTSIAADDSVSGLRRKLARTDRQKAEDAAERERAGVAATWAVIFGPKESQ
jgi:hypothetical protein